MSKISAELEVQTGGVVSAINGVAAKIASAFRPLENLSLFKGISAESAAGSGAIAGMQAALVAADGATSSLSATLAKMEAALHGVAGTSRIVLNAITLFPKMFGAVHPAIMKALSGVSLASRGFDVFRGKLTPLSAAMGFMELRNLGLTKSFAALVSVSAMAGSTVLGSSRKVSAAARGVSEGVGRGLGGIGKLLLGPIAAVGGLGASLVGLRSAFNLGGDLSDLSARTGITAGNLMVLQQAFKNSGVSADQVGPAVNRLQKALTGANEDGQDTAGIFGQLGLSLAQLNDLSPDQQFERVAKAINKLSDPSERAAAAMKIFGKSGGEMLALFNDSGAFGDAASQVGSQAAIMDRNAAIFDDISDKLALASQKMQGFFVGVADYVAPVLQPLLDWFASQDLAAQGQAFGLYIATAIQMLTDGTMLTALGDTFKLIAANFVNTIANGINSVVQALASVPGFGGVANLQIPTIDVSGLETSLGNALTSAMDKVESARTAADAAVKKPERLASEIEAKTKSGSGPSLSRLFSTSGGLFVKDPILAENRRQSSLLEKIDESIKGLKMTPASAGGPMRFT